MLQKVIFYIVLSFSFVYANVLNLDEAFDIKYTSDKDGIEFKFGLGQDIYIYKETFDVKISNQSILKMLNLPKPQISNEYEIYMQDFNIFIPINLIKSYIQNGNNKLILEYQGCAKNGICYRPQFKQFHLTQNYDKITLKELNLNDDEISDEQSIANTLLNSGFFVALITFFGFGLMLSLTPCVFPMIPILSSIIIAKNKSMSVKNGFLLSFVYVVAMSLAYAIAGVIASYIGSGVSSMLQNSYILGFFAFIFVILAFSMFGFYDIKLPSKFENSINTNSNKIGGFIGVFIMGFASALVVSPCVAAPLAGALLYISQSANVLYGGIMLFVMGLGMGVPLLIIGATSGRILPRPGKWMDMIKISFGFIMLLMSIWILARVIPPFYQLVAYGVVGVVWAVYLGAFDVANSGVIKLKKSLAILIFIYSVMLIVGGFIGGKNPLSPLENITTSTNKSELKFQKISNIDELLDTINSSTKPVLVDFWASWCVSCLELDNKTFSDPDVIKRLSEFNLVKIDVTENSSKNREILRHFSLIDPPVILFFNNANELKSKRIIGYINPKDFINKISDID